MLKYLHIENIAVIEQSDIEFSDGFNVLTGETGAGKSIVIDSINAVLGERTSKELIRAGCESALVSAVFGMLDDTAISILRENGFDVDEDGNVVISRKLSNSGKGLIKINEQPVTATVLREIGKYLINIHGQHDNQNLLNPDKHCSYIDAVADNAILIDAYYKEFHNLNTIRKELQALETDEDEKQRKTDLLNYQIKELQAASIKVGELEELKKKLDTAKKYELTVESLNKAYAAIVGDDDVSGASTLLGEAQHSLTASKNDEFEFAAAKLSDMVVELEGISADISSYLDNSELSEKDIENINQRLDFLYKLMPKYGNSEEEMLKYLESAQKQLNDITFSDKRTIELSDLLDQSTERLVSLGEKLTNSRKKAAEKFSKEVCDVLSYLNMPNVQFVVNIEKGRYTKRGCDNVEFMISANAGETVKPLHKIASGGELSRVMLAIKSALVDKDTVGTMIFDEIDTGISGYAAGKVGIQLKKVSIHRQVICVTHLAQIAALGKNHLLIQKTVKNGRTFTKVEPLSYNDRIGEIARIMSGTELTENLYNSAKELLDRSNNNDNL